MKKLFYVSTLALMLAACGGDETTNYEEYEEETAAPIPEEVEGEYPFPSSELMGDATITVSTAAGDSSNGNMPVLFVEDDDVIVQIGIDYANFDGSVETYVYINEIYNEKVQAGELMQSTLTLAEDNLKPGEYTVTAVQFTDNDPNKEPFNVAKAKFKIERIIS